MGAPRLVGRPALEGVGFVVDALFQSAFHGQESFFGQIIALEYGFLYTHTVLFQDLDGPVAVAVVGYIETDLIGKYVEKMVGTWKVSAEKAKSASRIDNAFLERYGFLK